MTSRHGIACACLACDNDLDDVQDAKARERAAEWRTDPDPTDFSEEPPC